APEPAAARLPDDPWQDILAGLENTPDAPGNAERIDGEIRIASQFLLDGMLRFERARVKTGDNRRLAAVMRRLGWSGPKPLRMGGTVAKGYVRRTADSQLNTLLTE